MAASISLAGLPSRFRKLQADFASLESTPPSVVAVCFQWPAESDPKDGVFRPEWVSFLRNADCVAGSWIRWATWRGGHWITANRKLMLFGDHRPANKLQKLFAAAWDLIWAGRGDLPLPIKIPPADAPPEDCFLSLCFDIAAAQKLPSPVRLKGDAIFTRIRENMALKLPAPRAFSPPTAQEIRDLAGEYQCLDGMPADHVVPWWAILDDVAATAAQLCYDIAELLEATPPQQHVATVPAAQPGGDQTAANGTAAATPPGGGFLGGEELAEALGIPESRRTAFRKQLERDRDSLGDGCWIEVQNRRPNAPQYLYKVNSPKLQALAAKYKAPND